MEHPVRPKKSTSPSECMLRDTGNMGPLWLHTSSKPCTPTRVLVFACYTHFGKKVTNKNKAVLPELTFPRTLPGLWLLVSPGLPRGPERVARGLTLLATHSLCSVLTRETKA